jgi:hypothetical protein
MIARLADNGRLPVILIPFDDIVNGKLTLLQRQWERHSVDTLRRNAPSH